MKNIVKTCRALKFKASYYSSKVERLSMSKVQSEEIGILVDFINSSAEGRSSLNEILTDANNVADGLGTVVEDTWKEDCSKWNEFKCDQETNGMSCHSGHQEPIIKSIMGSCGHKYKMIT